MLGLEPVDADATVATQLTAAVRAEASSADSRFATTREARGVVELRELASCRNDAPSCMAEIGAYLEVDFMLYGKLERGTLTLYLMDVGKRINRRALAVPVGAPAATARSAFDQLGARQ